MTESVKTVAVLFARADSIYKTMPGCDVYDIERDARTFTGGAPIVGHPPCRAWGRLSYFAKPRPGERELAPWCVDRIREWGGVLEHPEASKLWREKPLPAPGERDAWGGWSLVVDQDWWGHRAEKRTRLYIVGCEPRDIPLMPYSIEPATHVITPGRVRRRDGTRLKRGEPGWRPDVLKAEREATPPAFAEWLVELARRCAMRD